MNPRVMAAAPAMFVLLWSVGFLASKGGLAHAGPLSYMFMRFGCSAVAMVLIALAMGARFPSTPSLAGHVVFAGLLQHALYLTPNFWTMSRDFPAGLVALIGALQPLLTALLAGRFLGERSTRAQWIGLFVGLAGVLMVLSDKIAFDWRSPLDAGLVFLGMASLTVGTLWQKRFCSQMDLLGGSALQLVASALLTFCVMAAFEDFRVDFVWQFNVSLGYMVGMSLFLYTMMHAMFRGAGASRVASLFYLVPPVTCFLTWLFLDEQLGWLAIGGMLVTVSGVALATRKAN